MNNLTTFENDQFGNIRTIEEDGKIYFCGKDIASILGYCNTKDAIQKHCRKDGVAFYDLIDSIGRTQTVKFIDEGNLYRLITHSKLPTAEKFEQWVFDDVLPTIRKTGQYVIAPTDDTVKPMLIPDTKDYLTAARLIAHCPKDRLRVVIGFLEKGGFDVSVAKTEFTSISTADTSLIIEEAVQRTGLSVNKLASMLNIPSETFRAYYRKQRFPRPEKYAELVKALESINN